MAQRSNTASGARSSPAPKAKKAATGISGTQRDKYIAKLLDNPSFRESKERGTAYVFVGYPMPPSARRPGSRKNPREREN